MRSSAMLDLTDLATNTPPVPEALPPTVATVAPSPSKALSPTKALAPTVAPMQTLTTASAAIRTLSATRTLRATGVLNAAPTNDRDEFSRIVASMVPCRNNDPEIWFAEQTSQVERAKAMCRTCPLVQSCLTGALERSEPWGVWGGEVLVDGRIVAVKRGRGRPRKIVPDDERLAS